MTTSLPSNLDLLGLCPLFCALLIVTPYGLGATGAGVALRLPPMKCTWWLFCRWAGGFWFLDQAAGGALVVDWASWVPDVNLGWGKGGPPQFWTPPQFMGPEAIARGGTPHVLPCGWIPSKTGGAGILGDYWNCGFIDPIGENGPKGLGIPLWFWLTMSGDGVGSPGKRTGPHSIAISFCTPIPTDGTVCKDSIISLKLCHKNQDPFFLLEIIKCVSNPLEIWCINLFIFLPAIILLLL